VKKIIKFFNTFSFLNICHFYDTRLREGLVFGRAFSPLKFSARFFPFWFGKYNYNNIIIQAKGISKNDDIKISDSGTFNFTGYLEKKLLLQIRDILKLPFAIFSGYTTSGGTEANIYAMWIAREWATSKVKEKDRKIYWIIPNNAHYSINKALNLLNIKNNSDNEIIAIKTDSLGRADWQQIIKSIKAVRERGNDPIILPLTAMTTECGSIDPIFELNDFINKSKFDNIFFHVDAAFSGFFLPFLKEYHNIFSLSSLFSITVDFSKTIGGTVGSGAVIFRVGLEEYANIDAPYLLGNSDKTLTGSRSGLDVIAMYSLLAINSEENIRNDILDALKKTSFLAKEILAIDFIKLFYEPKLNYIVFSLVNIEENKEEKIRKILASYSISSSIVGIEDKKEELFKIIIRNDHTYRNIKKLIKDLKSATKT